MKKKLISFMLAAIMLFSCTSASFATTVVQPKGNRYYYVVETDARWLRTVTVTISETEAQIKDKIKEKLSDAMGDAIGNSIPNENVGSAVSSAISSFMQRVYAKDPYARAGTYKVSIKFSYKYEVDRLDETNRHLVQKWMVSGYELYQGGKLVDTYETKVTLK